jgi:putative acetyltransferase
VIINAESPDQPEVIALLDGSAAGCAALVRRDDANGDNEYYGELKRMFVAQRMRGQGVGKRLLEHIGMFAAMSGVRTIRLETGIHQPEAIALYERFGFVRRDPFGGYQPDPLSLFMEKRL